MEENVGSNKLIIHTCCAICGSEIAEAMKQGYDPVIFFSNPNIYDPMEYEARRDSAKKLADDLDIPFIEDDNDRTEWLAGPGTLTEEPEGGKRCAECFRLRLRRTADIATKGGVKNFTTTLAASPYKDEALIGKIGRESAGNDLSFVDPLLGRDKKGSWKKALDTAKRAGYYRQKYCGCEFSDRRSAEKK